MRKTQLAAALTLAALRLCGALSGPAAAEAPALSYTLSLGFETETAVPGMLVVRELLAASQGRLSGSADLSTSLDLHGPDQTRLVYSAGLRLSCLLAEAWGTTFFLDPSLRYRSLFAAGWEGRAGGTITGRWGAAAPSGRAVPGIGAFGDWRIGFEAIEMRLPVLPASLWQSNPLMRASFGWRFASGWKVEAAVQSFSEEDSTYFFRSLFDFGATLELEKLSLSGHLVLKYSDFFTPTGYLDGIALRLGISLPLDLPHEGGR
jgi:hypothetical protein